MVKLFWELMVLIDQYINHTAGDWLYDCFNPENNEGTFWDFSPRFCWWAQQGYLTRYYEEDEAADKLLTK